MLVWDIMKRPALTRYAEAALNPLLGKSLVVYATKPQATKPQATKPQATKPQATMLQAVKAAS
jgi:hypothetical protein